MNKNDVSLSYKMDRIMNQKRVKGQYCPLDPRGCRTKISTTKEMKRRFYKVLLFFIACIFFIACEARNEKTNCQEEDDVVLSLNLRNNDSIYKTCMRISTLNWLLEIDEVNKHHNQYIENWSGKYKDTIVLSDEGRRRINRLIIPDSTFKFIGNDSEELLKHYFVFDNSANNYCFAIDSIKEDSPYNIQFAIMYKMVEFGYYIAKDEESGFFFLDKRISN